MLGRARDASTLGVASIVSGLLAYVFLALSTRHLGAADAAPISVLWTYWSFASAAFTFPIQHWVARTVAADGNEAGVRGSLSTVTMVVLAVAVLSGVVAWLLRGVLFQSDDVGFPLLVAAVTLGSGFVGLVRGGLAARRRFGDLAAALVAENGLRVVLALVLGTAGVSAPIWYGAALAAGALVGVIWTSAIRFEGGVIVTGGVSVLSLLGGAAGGQLIGQTVLTGGPVVLALTGGSPAQVTQMFAALALFRIPYTVALPVTAKLTGGLTVLYVQRRMASLKRLRGAITGSVIVGAPLAAGVGALLGPPLLPWVFGSGIDLSAGLCAVLAAGSYLALVNLLVTVMLIASGRSWALVRAWTLAVVGAAVVLVVLSDDALRAVCVAFLVAETIAWVALIVEEHRRMPD